MTGFEASYESTEMLKALLGHFNESQAELADALNVSQPTLNRWINGVSRPRPIAIRSIIELYNSLESEENDNKIALQYSKILSELREIFHSSGRFSNRNEILDQVSSLIYTHTLLKYKKEEGLGIILKDANPASRLRQLVDDTVRATLKLDNQPHLTHSDFSINIRETENELALSIGKLFSQYDFSNIDKNNYQELDFINSAFGSFLTSSFSEEKEMGQYLTPVEVIEAMISLIEPYLLKNSTKRDFSILDPSCGVGSFLVAAFHRMVRNKSIIPLENSSTAFYGIDKSERMARLAITNLATFGMSYDQIYNKNAITESFQFMEGKIDVIITNPPFGAMFPSREIRKLKNIKGSAENISSEIIFFDRYLEWLKPKGLALVVIPDNILTGKGVYATFREELTKNFNISAIISLPPITFSAAGTTTKTSILLLSKDKSVKDRTFIGVASDIGYQVVTQGAIRKKIAKGRNELLEILENYKNGEDGENCAWVEDFSKFSRWDPNFHLGRPERLDTLLNDSPEKLIRLTDLADIVNERTNPQRMFDDVFPYIEISDISGETSTVHPKLTLISEAPSRARKIVQKGDILVSTVRPERKSIGIYNSPYPKAICSTGIAVLRSKGTAPLLLAKLMHNDIVTQQLIKHNVGVAYPVVDEKAFSEILLPITKESLIYLDIIAGQLEIHREEERILDASLNEMLDNLLA